MDDFAYSLDVSSRFYLSHDSPQPDCLVQNLKTACVLLNWRCVSENSRNRPLLLWLHCRGIAGSFFDESSYFFRMGNIDHMTGTRNFDLAAFGTHCVPAF